MGDLQPAVVMAEFWDPAAALGGPYTLNHLDDLVGEMRRRGYAWHLVLYRIDGNSEVSFFTNHSQSVSRSWGNVLFFSWNTTFLQQAWWLRRAFTVDTFFKNVREPMAIAVSSRGPLV